MVDEVGVTLGKNVKSEIDICTCFSFHFIPFPFFPVVVVGEACIGKAGVGDGYAMIHRQ